MNENALARLRQFQRRALIVAGAGALLCIAGLSISPRQFFISYLWSFIFWLGLALGCLVLAMIHSLTGGRWGDVTRRFQEAGYSTLPIMALLFVPILFGLHVLYPWARPADVAASVVLQKRGLYATLWPFIGRAVFVFAVWITMAALLRRWSLRQDATRDAGATRRMRALSGPGLIIYTLTVTLAAVDWIMSLEQRWFSTMFPIIVCISQVVSALTFSILLLALFRKEPPLARALTRDHLHQLGNLLLAFVMFWTYISFGQLLIIYSANVPRETGWYLHRIAGNWKWIISAIALLHFFLPFYLLLFRPLKRRIGPLAALAALVIVMRMVDVYWYVEPGFFPSGIHVSWLDFVAPITVGSIWLAAFASNLTKADLMPRNDPRFQSEAVAHGA